MFRLWSKGSNIREHDHRILRLHSMLWSPVSIRNWTINPRYSLSRDGFQGNRWCREWRTTSFTTTTIIMCPTVLCKTYVRKYNRKSSGMSESLSRSLFLECTWDTKFRVGGTLSGPLASQIRLSVGGMAQKEDEANCSEGWVVSLLSVCLAYLSSPLLSSHSLCLSAYLYLCISFIVCCFLAIHRKFRWLNCNFQDKHSVCLSVCLSVVIQLLLLAEHDETRWQHNGREENERSKNFCAFPNTRTNNAPNGGQVFCSFSTVVGS